MTAIVAFIISHELPDWNGHPKLPSIVTKKSPWNRKRKNCNILTWLLSENNKMYVWFFNTCRQTYLIFYEFISLWFYAVKILWLNCTYNFVHFNSGHFFVIIHIVFDCYIFFLSCAIRRNLQSVKGTQNYLLRVLVRK